MAMYDPSQATEYAGPSPGRKVLHGVGFKRYSAQTGTPMLQISFVILADLENAGDEGKIVNRNFAITQKAMNFLGLFCKAVGWMQPFDPEDDDTIERIISSGPCLGILEDETYNGNTKTKLKSFARHQYNDHNLEAKLQAGEVAYREYLQRMEEFRNNRNSGGGSSGGYGGGSSGGGYSGGVGGGSGYGSDDDIPFARSCSGAPRWVAACESGVPHWMHRFI